MIELAFVILLNRIVTWGREPIIATRTIAADADALHELLADPANQWRLATAFADVTALQPAGKHCDARLRLPFGVRRPASMHVKPSRKHRLLTSDVRLGHRTVAWVTWILTPDPGTTEADVAVQLESRSLLTRLALLLGGRRWIARRLDTTLATLATTAARVAEDVATTPATIVVHTPDPPAKTDRALKPDHAPIHR